jgi:hypothetical protein
LCEVVVLGVIFCNFSTLCIDWRLKKKLKCGSHTSSSEGRATQLEEKQGHGRSLYLTLIFGATLDS